jgi:hypothetical protein
MSNEQVLTALVMGRKMLVIDIPYTSIDPGIRPNTNMPGTFYCSLQRSVVDAMEFTSVIILRDALEEIVSIQEKKKFLLGHAEYGIDLLGNDVVICYFAEAKEQDGNYLQVH